MSTGRYRYSYRVTHHFNVEPPKPEKQPDHSNKVVVVLFVFALVLLYVLLKNN